MCVDGNCLAPLLLCLSARHLALHVHDESKVVSCFCDFGVRENDFGRTESLKDTLLLWLLRKCENLDSVEICELIFIKCSLCEDLLLSAETSHANAHYPDGGSSVSRS